MVHIQLDQDLIGKYYGVKLSTQTHYGLHDSYKEAKERAETLKRKTGLKIIERTEQAS